MQRDEVEQLVGQFDTVLGHATRKGVFLQLGVRQVIRLDTLAKHFAVCANAPHRDAAKADAVVALFTANQPCFAGLALGAPVGTGHLERSVGGLRARAGEERVIQALGRQFFEFVGQFKGQRVAKLEAGRVIQGVELTRHCLGDLAAAMAQATGPQAREAVKNLPPVRVSVVTAFGPNNHARVGLEVAVAGVGHPVRVQPGGVGARGGVQFQGVAQVHGRSFISS